ncbi:MAG: GNAT family N-acetyltransferase [Polyangiaceae bacterium]
MKTVRLGPADAALARTMFAMMAAVFSEPTGVLSDEYIAHLLGRADFWALAAIEGDEVVGGLTAHTLPMTRAEGSEVFLYDLAVRPDRQRTGIGRSLVARLREGAAACGADNVFVPADDEDDHAIEFYRALGGSPSPVTIFTFEH